MDCSTPGVPVHHQLPELTRTHVRRVGDALPPSRPLSPPSPPAFKLCQHQGLCQCAQITDDMHPTLPAPQGVPGIEPAACIPGKLATVTIRSVLRNVTQTDGNSPPLSVHVIECVCVSLSIQSGLRFHGGSDGRELMRESWVQFPDWEDPLQEGTATHSSVLAWRIPRMEGPGGATVQGVVKSQTRPSNFHPLGIHAGLACRCVVWGVCMRASEEGCVLALYVCVQGCVDLWYVYTQGFLCRCVYVGCVPTCECTLRSSVSECV